MTLLALPAAESIAAVEEPPSGPILAGSPVTTTRLTYQSADGRQIAGRWTATEGSWQVNYGEWEYIRVISGRCRLEGADGTVRSFGPGDQFVIEPGFSGTWTVVEAMEKDFVILQP